MYVAKIGSLLKERGQRVKDFVSWYQSQVLVSGLYYLFCLFFVSVLRLKKQKKKGLKSDLEVSQLEIQIKSFLRIRISVFRLFSSLFKFGSGSFTTGNSDLGFSSYSYFSISFVFFVV